MENFISLLISLNAFVLKYYMTFILLTPNHDCVHRYIGNTLH